MPLIQEVMDDTLRDEIGHGVQVYLDDVLMYSETEQGLTDTIVRVLRSSARRV